MATVRFRTRFTPWVEVDPTASTRAEQGRAAGGPDSLLGKILAPEVEFDSGFAGKLGAAPWGRSTVPWWVWPIGVAVLGHLVYTAMKGR